MMTRVKGWEKALKEVMQRHMALPSEFGVSDCYLICDDTVLAITGERMYPDAIGYTSELGAAKKLAAHDFANVEQAFAAKFEIIHPMHAQRGDIGVIDNDGAICGGVFTALGFMVRDENQITFLPVTRVKAAFKVGR